MLAAIQHATEIVAAGKGFLEALISLVPIVVTICSAISALIPKPKRPGLWADIHHVITMAGLNVRHARNAE